MNEENKLAHCTLIKNSCCNIYIITHSACKKTNNHIRGRIGVRSGLNVGGAESIVDGEL